MQNHNRKLDQLTSLRFIAAMMIVIHHSTGMFGIGGTGVNLGQGVSFFFVLSGFILTYVYPKLDTWLEIRQFWRARVARIWPAYFVCFLIMLIPMGWDSKTAIANLLMVQAWIPLSTYYFSYNAVSWSVSTEFFFYLVFPFILYDWSRNWLVKLLSSGAILIGLIVLSNLLSLPHYGDPGTGMDGLLFTQHGLVYINPLSRIFEFIYGMCVAHAWRNNSGRTWTPFPTIYELGAISLCIVSLYGMNFASALAEASFLGAPAALWLTHSGSVFVFGLLIYVMAQGRGNISKILAHPYLVLLGEISFSIYLIHQILLRLYKKVIAGHTLLPDSIAYIVFLSILLLVSYLMWSIIEMPGRRWIMGHRKIHGTAVMKKSWHDHLICSRNNLLAVLTLICIILLLRLTM